MKWNFPEVMTTRTIDERVQKVKDEIAEFEVNMNIKEAIDVLHSVETLLRGIFTGNEDILDQTVGKVFAKNAQRGYYSKPCF